MPAKTKTTSPRPKTQNPVFDKKWSGNESDTRAKILLSWKAPIRPFKKRNREFFSTAGAIAFLVSIILFFLKEWFLIIVIIAFFFLTYVLSTVPPEQTEHMVTNKGVVAGGKKYRWDQLGDFWFSEQWGQEILNIQTPFQFPGRLIMLLGNQKQKPIEDLLSRFLELEKPELGAVEKASNWLSKKIPLEGQSSS